jgi:hypothetical protein
MPAFGEAAPGQIPRAAELFHARAGH